MQRTGRARTTNRTAAARRQGGGQRRHRKHPRLGLAWLLGPSVAVGACLAGAVSASAATVAEGLTVAPPPVRSVTVSAERVQCAPALTIPNGICLTPMMTVTNGPTAGHVTINGADAVPSRGTPNWTLCGGIGPICSPGMVDQFVNAENFRGTAMPLAAAPIPDLAFGSNGAATAGKAVMEQSEVFGPNRSTNPSLSFFTSITWTAVP